MSLIMACFWISMAFLGLLGGYGWIHEERAVRDPHRPQLPLWRDVNRGARILWITSIVGYILLVGSVWTQYRADQRLRDAIYPVLTRGGYSIDALKQMTIADPPTSAVVELWGDCGGEPQRVVLERTAYGWQITEQQVSRSSSSCYE